MRPGWKGSIWSSFSPVPINLIGLPVTSFDAQGGAAAGVAIELAEHHTGDIQLCVKGLRRR